MTWDTSLFLYLKRNSTPYSYVDSFVHIVSAYVFLCVSVSIRFCRSLSFQLLISPNCLLLDRWYELYSSDFRVCIIHLRQNKGFRTNNSSPGQQPDWGSSPECAIQGKFLVPEWNSAHTRERKPITASSRPITILSSVAFPIQAPYNLLVGIILKATAHFQGSKPQRNRGGCDTSKENNQYKSWKGMTAAVELKPYVALPAPPQELGHCSEEECPCLQCRVSERQYTLGMCIYFLPHSNGQTPTSGQRKGAIFWLGMGDYSDDWWPKLYPQRYKWSIIFRALQDKSPHILLDLGNYQAPLSYSKMTFLYSIVRLNKITTWAV